MSWVKLLVFAAVAYGGYNYWSEQRMAKMVAQAMESGEFIAVPMPDGFNASNVIVFAPADCPKEAGLRADELMRSLAQQGIPATRSNRATFSGENMKAQTMAQLKSVMNSELPIVFIRGTAKASPNVQETVAQYRKLK